MEPEGELHRLPSQAVLNANNTAIAYNLGLDSLDELEMMDKKSQRSLESGLTQHTYMME